MESSKKEQASISLLTQGTFLPQEFICGSTGYDLPGDVRRKLYAFKD